MLEVITSSLEQDMNKAMDALKHEFSAIRTGRANPALLQNVQVDSYGSKAPLASVASISVSDTRTLLVNAWDANNVKSIDTGIRHANLGLNPRIDGNKLFISLPELTQERRQEFIKLAKKKSEDIKIRIRNARRDANEELKKLEKNKEISEDQLKTEMENVQKITDSYIKKIEDTLKGKQEDLEAI